MYLSCINTGKTKRPSLNRSQNYVSTQSRQKRRKKSAIHALLLLLLLICRHADKLATTLRRVVKGSLSLCIRSFMHHTHRMLLHLSCSSFSWPSWPSWPCPLPCLAPPCGLAAPLLASLRAPAGPAKKQSNKTVNTHTQQNTGTYKLDSITKRHVDNNNNIYGTMSLYVISHILLALLFVGLASV